jgi:HK97 family phage portal protein
MLNLFKSKLNKLNFGGGANSSQKSINTNYSMFLDNGLSYLLGRLDNGSISNDQAIRFYKENAILFNALKIIADNYKIIPYVLKDTVKDEFVTDHPLLTRLNNPNPFVSGDEFAESLLLSYIITGDAYVEVIGSKEVVELTVLASQSMSIQKDSSKGIISEYMYTPSNGTSINYKYNAKEKGYFAKNGNELINLKNYNPYYPSNNGYGLSYIEPIRAEISQYLLSSLHNESLLKNGARPDMMLTFKGSDNANITTETEDEIKNMLRENVTGASNAGRSVFLNGDFDLKQLSMAIKDMDFPQLREQISTIIYNNFNIPLPMVKASNMTLANMDVAKLNLYDNAIIPFVDIVRFFLGTNLLKRYSDGDRYVLTYDESEIPELRPRKADNIEKLSKSGVLTVNEMRSLLGYESIPGGDSLYQPATLVPVGTDTFTEDNRETPSRKNSEALSFVRHLKGQVNSKGDRIYSDEEIESLVSEQYNGIH